MKKITLFAFLSMLVFISCSDDDKDDNKDDEWKELHEKVIPNEMEYYTPSRRFDYNGPEDVLGYGYDVTGKVASYESVRAQAIDVGKLEREHEFGSSYVAHYPIHYHYSFGISGANVKEYLFRLTAAFEGRDYDALKKDSIVYFSGTLFNNELLKDPQNKYSYRSEHLVSKSRGAEIPFYDSSSEREIVRPYFTDEFTDDIKYLEAKDMVRKYGTHIIRKYVIGRRFDMLYRSEIRPTKYLSHGDTVVIEVNKYRAVKAGSLDTQPKIKAGFMHWESPDSEFDRQVRLNINPVLYIGAQGGMTGIVPAGVYNLEKGYPDSKLTEWTMSVNEDSHSLIYVNEPFPLYELLEGSPRREELKRVIEEYILASQIK